MTGASPLELNAVERRNLKDGCAACDVDLSEQQLDQLQAYLNLLERWNKAYNLTAVRAREQMVVRHLLDSLSVAPFLQSRRLLDVGSGAGLPGIPLAIARPDIVVDLLDSNGKKTRFLFHVKTALALDNMTVHCTRVEALQAAEPYPEILSRAFAPLDEIVRLCRHLLSPDGRILAMKGALPERELAEIPALGMRAKTFAVDVPGLAEQRHLIALQPAGINE